MRMMLDRLEAKFGRFAIPDFIRYVVLFNALVYVLELVTPGFASALTLEPQAVFSGEIWRLFTWIFIPRTTSPFWILFALLFLWFLGDLLESSWTSFRVNLFYLTGWFLTTVAGLMIPGANTGPGANLFLNLTVLFAAATMQPNYQILLFFVIPLKLKWLAIISTLFPAMFFLASPLAGKVAIALCFANYLLFFGPGYVRNRALSAKAAGRRAKFEAASKSDDTMHRCAVCGRTEVSDPDLEFRVSSDDLEYCVDHLPGKSAVTPKKSL